MEALIAILLIYSAIPQAQPGTFQAVGSGSQIVRMDTRTGAVEKCSLIGNAIDCRSVQAAQIETSAAK